MLVQIKDLKKRPELNGKVGYLVSDRPNENGRFAVEIPQTDGALLKRENFDFMTCSICLDHMTKDNFIETPCHRFHCDCNLIFLKMLARNKNHLRYCKMGRRRN